MKAFAILFVFAIIGVAYTAKKQQEEDGDGMKSLMEELMKGVVAQVQEEEDQQSSVELQDALSDLLGQVQDDEDGDDLSALLQDDDDDGDGARNQEEEEEDGGLLAFLQEEGGEGGDDGAEIEEEDDDGGDALMQGWLGRVFNGIRRFGGRVRGVCRRVNKYTRYLNCIPRMQAEMQKADDGDEELANELIRRIVKVQQEGGDDAEAQIFGKIFRTVRKFWKRGRGIFKRVKKRIGRVYRGYRNIRNCVRRYG